MQLPALAAARASLKPKERITKRLKTRASIDERMKVGWRRKTENYLRPPLLPLYAHDDAPVRELHHPFLPAQ
jgi:hypothetical protein